MFIRIICFVVFLFLGVTPAISSTHVASAQNPQELELKRWRQSMTDYEQRLTERVGKVNRRVVSIRRVMFWILAVNLIGFTCLIILVLRGGAPDIGNLGALFVRRESEKQRSMLKNILKRQKKLHQGVRHMQAYVSETANVKARTSQALDNLERQLAGLERDLRKLNIDDEEEPSEAT